MNSPAARKAQLRRELRIARKSIPPALVRLAARRAAVRLMRLLRTLHARRVGVYLASGSELDTAPLIAALHRARIAVYVPAVCARAEGRMQMLPLSPRTALRRKRFGIREPVSRATCAPARVDVLVLPLLGFDSRGTRLGSGAGYYDRWIAGCRPRPLCIGHAFAAQERMALPRQSWDRPLDAVCTELGLRRFPRQ